MPGRDETSPQVADWRRRDIEELKPLLWQLYGARADVRKSKHIATIPVIVNTRVDNV